MKIIVAILATAAVSASITFVVSSTNDKVQVEVRREVRNDRSGRVIAELQKKLREAEAEAGKVEVQEVIVPGASTDSPEEVLKYLSELQMGNSRGSDTDEHRVLVRQVIRQFAEITAAGSNALPAIERFLDQGLDMPLYEHTSQISARNWERGDIYLDPIWPPSLRIGLFNSLRHIAKRDGTQLQGVERIILKVMNTTARSLEVAYLARVLDDLSKDQHKEAYLQAAHELLIYFYDKTPKSAAGLRMAQNERETIYLDRENRSMLWNLLRQNRDTTFMDQAKNELLYEYNRKERKDGEEIEVATIGIDQSVLSYLTGVLGDKAMPIIRDIYERPDVGDRNRSTLRGVAARYVGLNEDANIMINSRINERGFKLLATIGKSQKSDRERGLKTVRYYLEKIGEGRNVAPETLQARQQYLSSLRVQTKDKEVLTWMDNTQKRLVAMNDPEKAKRMDNRFDVRRKPDQNRDRR